MYRFSKRLFNFYLHPDRQFARKMRTLLGFVPSNLSIFRSAFSHRSASVNQNGYLANNERLEFLGDALLSSIVADYLYAKYITKKEGFLTKMRSKIVKRVTLNIIAEKMELDIYLADQNQTHISKSMMGNAFEALIGAIYVDKGYDYTKKYVINKILLEYIDMQSLELSDDNFKSALLEFCQKNGRQVEFKLVSKYKHQKRDRFKMAVLVDGVEVSQSDAFNKKSAEQDASKKALQSIGVKTKQKCEEAIG